jgi:glutamyl-tRNA synthetase
MDWGNAFVRKISRSSDSGPITSLEMELNLAGDFKKTKKKVTWLASPKTPSSPEDLTQVSTLASLAELISLPTTTLPRSPRARSSS